MASAETKTAASICPKFIATFEILGRKWNGLIVEVLLIDGPKRFKDLAVAIETCSDRVLVERLKELEEAQIIERIPVSESTRHAYQLTERGEAMRPMMSAIHTWADQYN
ncbi:helix-turn-helix transcriptional regulator [Weissella coleopterorum]|uniref:Helix-turn-helix transcriptional regulator n=1 Tax=Weissella coleopterorum TaxID=2714949 RepID=A0A6G8AZ89_9LACO|nr:helix-turn-helix domain-containing protein [Weissella coleopterorum]QIL50275.1 helix-turn-helix transcriptional regulator [Weissella coleopterorum]